MAELRRERDEAFRMIMTLKEELRLQEDHFNKVSGQQAHSFSKMVEKSLQEEKKTSELMAKLNSEPAKTVRFRLDNGWRVTEEASAQ